MIEAQKIPNKPEWKIKLEGKIVGKILFLNPDFQYVPKGQTQGGEKFPTLNKCLDSLRAA